MRHLKHCFSIALTLWGVIVADQWLALNAPLGIYARLSLIFGVAVTVTALLYRPTLSGRAYPSAAIDRSDKLTDTPRPPEQLRRELALAIEHLESIQVLLEISGGHQQPVPRAVPANLNLVLKHLRSAGKQLDPETQRDLCAPESLSNSPSQTEPTYTTRAF